MSKKSTGKKALFNISCDGISYERGKIYAAKDVAHLDPNDFEDAEVEVEETKEEAKPKIDTTGTDELDSSKKDEDLDSAKKDEEVKDEKKEEETKPKAK